MRSRAISDSSERSAAIAPSLGLIVGFSVLLLVTVDASDPVNWNDPGWWTSYGAMNTNTANNSAVANQGELKQFTSAAVKELNVDLATFGGAGTQLTTLVSGWQQDYSSGGYASNTGPPYYGHKPSDYHAVNVGQLKQIASLIYNQLSAAGYTGLYPSWIVMNPATDGNAATVGQLKEVFDFDLSLASPTNLTASSNTNGTVNLTWTLPANNQATSYYLYQQNVDGTWSLITTLTNPNATSYSVANLAAGENPAFEIIAQKGRSASAIQETAADPGLSAPTNLTLTSGASAGEIDLTWINHATDATYVLIEKSTDGVNWSVVTTVPSNATSYEVMGLTVGQSYYFGVAAGNN